MNSQRILVLGGSGFVGRSLVARLAADGHRVLVATRGAAALRTPLPAGVETRSGDVYDPVFLAAALAGADAVVNLVGILNEDGDSGEGFERVFVTLAETLVAAMQQAGVTRLLQMSALHAGDGDSHYLQARGRAEARVRASGLAWTLFRPSVIAGPGDGLFCRFDALLRFAPLLPLGRADARFQPVWIGDVTAAFARALGDDDTVGKHYDLVGPEVMTLAEIVQAGAAARGRRRLVLPLPQMLGRVQAEIGEHLPGKPISRDNWRSLQRDSTSSDNGLERLGLTPTDVRARLPEILAGC